MAIILTLIHKSVLYFKHLLRVFHISHFIEKSQQKLIIRKRAARELSLNACMWKAVPIGADQYQISDQLSVTKVMGLMAIAQEWHGDGHMTMMANVITIHNMPNL